MLYHPPIPKLTRVENLHHSAPTQGIDAKHSWVFVVFHYVVFICFIFAILVLKKYQNLLHASQYPPHPIQKNHRQNIEISGKLRKSLKIMKFHQQMLEYVGWHGPILIQQGKMQVKLESRVKIMLRIESENCIAVGEPTAECDALFGSLN